MKTDGFINQGVLLTGGAGFTFYANAMKSIENHRKTMKSIENHWKASKIVEKH